MASWVCEEGAGGDFIELLVVNRNTKGFPLIWLLVVHCSTIKMYLRLYICAIDTIYTTHGKSCSFPWWWTATTSNSRKRLQISCLRSENNYLDGVMVCTYDQSLINICTTQHKIRGLGEIRHYLFSSHLYLGRSPRWTYICIGLLLDCLKELNIVSFATLWL